MPCGCQSACGCNITAGPGVSVTRIGDNFIVTNTQMAPVQNVYIQQANPGPQLYPYVWWELDGLDNLVTTWIFTP